MNLDFNEWKALKKEVKKRKAEAETKYKDDFARHINQSPIFPKNRPIEKCDDCKNSPNLCLSCQQKYLVWSPNLVD